MKKMIFAACAVAAFTFMGTEKAEAGNVRFGISYQNFGYGSNYGFSYGNVGPRYGGYGYRAPVYGYRAVPRSYQFNYQYNARPGFGGYGHRGYGNRGCRRW